MSQLVQMPVAKTGASADAREHMRDVVRVKAPRCARRWLGPVLAALRSGPRPSTGTGCPSGRWHAMEHSRARNILGRADLKTRLPLQPAHVVAWTGALGRRPMVLIAFEPAQRYGAMVSGPPLLKGMRDTALTGRGREAIRSYCRWILRSGRPGV